MNSTSNQSSIHLILKCTGRFLAVGDEVPISKGIMADRTDNPIKLDEIVIPSDQDSAGFITFNVNSEGIPSHQGPRPDVIGATFVSQEWIEDALRLKIESPEAES